MGAYVDRNLSSIDLVVAVGHLVSLLISIVDSEMDRL